MLTRTFGSGLPVFALLFIGVAVEKYYVSRVTVFANTIALNVSFLSLNQAPASLVLYGDAGLIIGAYGLVCYLLDVKTFWGYNAAAFFAYASLPVAAVILAAPGDWWWVLLVAGTVNAAAGWVLEEEIGIGVVHWGPRSGTVRRFIDTAKMTYLDGFVTREVELALGEFDR